MERNPDDHDKVREVQNSTNSLIREAKQTYYEKLGDKLSNPQTGQKIFWSAFKSVTNKKSTQMPNTEAMNYSKAVTGSIYFRKIMREARNKEKVEETEKEKDQKISLFTDYQKLENKMRISKKMM